MAYTAIYGQIKNTLILSEHLYIIQVVIQYSQTYGLPRNISWIMGIYIHQKRMEVLLIKGVGGGSVHIARN